MFDFSATREPKLINENDQFHEKVKEAVKVVETILDNTRNPTLASPDHNHSYEDKYTLSEFLTNTAVTSFLNVLDKMGLGCNATNNNGGGVESTEQTTSGTTTAAEALRKLTSIAQDDKKSITMRFVARETCSFICENEIEIESPRVVEDHRISTSTENIVNSVLSRVIKTKVKEYHWKIEIEYGIYIYSGNETGFNETNSFPIITNTISTNLVTRTSLQPFSPLVDVDPNDVSLTWLLKTLNKDSLESEFHIDREKPTCRTPRNNDDIMKAWEFFSNIGRWCIRVQQYFNKKDNQIFEKDNHDKSHLNSITGEGIFVPVLPLLESLEDSGNQSPIMSNDEVNLFLNKQYLTITKNIDSLKNHFDGQIMSPVEAMIVLLTKHTSSIVQYYFNGVNHIEDMLCTQLFNAIGKHVSSDDLDDFVRSYNQKLFSETYAPESFCYAIRRPGYYPDGLISIEEHKSDGNANDGERNAMTFTRQLETSKGENPMYIPINSATSIEFSGNLFLHAWMMQRFQQSHGSFQLAACARQFSSFLLLVGKLSGPNTFEPEHGIILQNQDEVLIPLLLEEMPSAKEFKDAIESLSPEQQRFAKAFRSMKLSSSVFGICVIQLKPQLEMLLGLPEKSLTKEIRLTQSLLSLFIDYQIPSDLLSFDGGDDLDATAKVDIVKDHVKNVEAMIEDLKQQDMKKARLEADMAFEIASKERSEEVLCEESEEDAGFASHEGLFGVAQMAPRMASHSPFGSAPFGSAPPVASTYVMKRSMKSTSRRNSTGRGRGGRGGTRMMAIPAPATANMNSPKLRQQDPTEAKNQDITIDQSFNDLDCYGYDHSDLTKIPSLLDSKFEMFGDDEKYGGALRSTIIKTGERWSKKRKQNILSKLESIPLTVDDQKSERQKAFDLLDALSRSGVLPLSHAELHVVIASTHCFDKSVVNTVVQDNVNPIEKIERSHLLVASIIHNVNLKELLCNDDEIDRISNHSPLLMIANEGEK